MDFMYLNMRLRKNQAKNKFINFYGSCLGAPFGAYLAEAGLSRHLSYSGRDPASYLTPGGTIYHEIPSRVRTSFPSENFGMVQN